MSATSTASYILDSESYIQHGAFDTDSSSDWANTFTALGGEKCFITASWLTNTDGPVMEVTGTDEALAFVEQTVRA
jgi:hypothetical protein